jgi:hypothetical protein
MLYEVQSAFWTLPVLVTWHDVMAEVKLPDIPWLKKQKETITDWLLANGDYRDDAWWILKNRLEKVAVISLRDDPEDVVVWTQEAACHKQDLAGKGDYREPFIDGYVNSPWAIITDGAIMELIWSSLKKYMLHQLVNERKPIDLFFCKLVPLLFRPNWKEVALRKETLKGGPGMYNPDPQSIVNRGLADELARGIMTGFNPKTQTCCWTLEVIPLAPWLKNTQKLEAAIRRRTRGVFPFVVAQRLLRQLDYAIEVYSSYLEKASVPFMRVPDPGETGGAGRKVRRKYGRGVKHSPSSPGAISHVVCSPDMEARKKPSVEVEDESLPEMPVLQPGAPELRDSGDEAA